MKRKAVVVLVVFAGLTLCSVNANAGKSEIILGHTSQTVRFQGTGGNTLDLFLGMCKKNHGCILGGIASGTGIFASGPAHYQLFTPAFLGKTPNITLTLVNATLGTWKVHELEPIEFLYGNKNSPLLTGDLDLLSFQQAPGSHTGAFNYLGAANLTDLGGSLAHLFASATGIVELSIHLGGNIESLLGNRKGMTSHGSGSIAAVPELGSMLLLGSGLLLMGGFLRRRQLSG